MLIKNFMQQDHRACDDYFATAEQAFIDKEFDKGKHAFDTFVLNTLHHFDMEEQVLFVEYETATGNTQGPTQVMRMEHEQMRQLIGRMQGALDSESIDDFMALAEPMMILLQQHNMKEEQMLYPMCDSALGGTDVLPKMQSI